jgi:hypothetical protein
MESKYIYLNTSNRSSGSIVQPTWSLRDPLNNILSIRCAALNLPNTFYNISAALSTNTFTVTDTGGTVTITLSDGFYTATSLYAALKTALDADGTLNGTYTLSQSTTTFKTTISCNVNFSISTATNLSRLLGYSSTTATGLSAVSENIPNLTIGPIYLELVNMNLRTNFDTQVRNTLSIVFPDQDFGALLSLPVDDPSFVAFTQKQSIDRIQLQLVNEDGILLNNNGVDYSVVLELTLSNTA